MKTCLQTWFRTAALGASLLVAAGGCVVGPDFHQPVVNVPSHWTAPLVNGETNTSVSLAAWWKNFHDPELDSLIDRAVGSNMDLRILRARVLEARAQYGVQAAELWPTADASGSYARQQTSHHQPVLGSLPVPSDVPFENDVYQAAFDASWELDVFGGKHRGREAARAEVGAAEYGREAGLVTLLGEVARNYVEVCGQQRRLAIARENIHAQQEALAVTRNRYSNGLASNLDVQQASTLLANTRAQVPVIQSQLQNSIHRLAVLLGQPPGALVAELEKEHSIPAASVRVPVGLPSDLLLRRPDVRQADRELAAATANIGVARADLFPKLYLTGVAGFESVSASDWFAGGSRLWSVGPTVQWRVFDAGRIRANIKVQTARQEQALARYERTVLAAFEEVENNLVSYANERERHSALEDAVASSRSSLELARRLYANGLADFLNVLEAERSLYQAQDQLVQSEETVDTDLIALYKALGGGWNMNAVTSVSARTDRAKNL